MGYDDSSIVWTLGTHSEAGEPLYAVDFGYAEGYLNWPRSAQRVGNNTLITDQTAMRVIEVEPSGRVVWQYGTNGVQGQGPGCLFDPSGAVRAEDGTTFIVDGKDIGRVLRIGAEESVISIYPDPEDTPENGTLYEPRAIDISDTGTLDIEDEGHDRIIEVGRSATAKASSREIDCGLPGVKKRFLGLDWAGDVGGGGSVALFYSVDGGTWKTARPAKTNTLPSSTVGTTIRYRVSVTTGNHLDAPVVESVAIRYEIAGSSKSAKPSTTPTTTPKPSKTTTVTPGAKSGTGTGLGAGGMTSDVAFGPLEYASGTVLRGVNIPMPGMPGTGLGSPVVPGVVGGLSLVYLTGFAISPARLLGARLVAVVHRRR